MLVTDLAVLDHTDGSVLLIANVVGGAADRGAACHTGERSCFHRELPAVAA